MTNYQIDQKNIDEILKTHKLSHDDYSKIIAIIGREPNLIELGLFSVMWSEHCSYKTTRIHLKKLPTEAEWVICGPGENAGVIDIGEGKAAIFKMESHNHPSFIEPYQGAATGVGGIMRDVFTMGARPVANLNALRFGDINHPKTKHLVAGVVAGIGGYGNCVGVPTIAGECSFDSAYNGNILVNAMCVGIAEQDKIFYSAASHIGASVLYVGSKTGRDGIHGATMASDSFDDNSDEQRPTVQVGDPFAEKLLIEACLELMQTDAIIAIQDMGAAGLTSSSLEMASKGGSGIELDLSKVPQREDGMSAYEIMLSESQERMLMVLRPGKEQLAYDVFEKWELDAAIIGKIAEHGQVKLYHHGDLVADIPVAPLADEAPILDRPYDIQPAINSDIPSEALELGEDIISTMKLMLATPDLVKKSWIWEQYDRQVQNNTISPPGGNAAVVRISNDNPDNNRALAVTCDCNPHYCFADAHMGAMQAVAESYRNLCAVGATPLAVTNCLNFGNPEIPEIMGQIVAAIEGIAKACDGLDFPVVSGNVSLYNQTNDNSILPTPQIGAVGLLEDGYQQAGKDIFREGCELYMVGEFDDRSQAHLGCSLYMREIAADYHNPKYAPPKVDLEEERQNGEFVRAVIAQQLVNAVHDISDGGLAIALAEMLMKFGYGAEVVQPQNYADIHPVAFWFGEDQARYVVAVLPGNSKKFQELADKYNVSIAHIGKSQGRMNDNGKLSIRGAGSVDMSELRVVNNSWPI